MILPRLKRIFKIDFFKDSFWALLGNVMNKGSILINSIVLAKILSKDSFGVFNSLRNTLTTLAIFTTFGLGFTSTKFIADCVKRHEINPSKILKKIYSIAIGFSGFFSLLLFVFASEVSLFYYNSTEFIHEIRTLSLWVLILAITTTQEGIISGLGAFKKMSGINIIVGILTIVLIPIMAYYYGVRGACWSLLIIQSVYLCFNTYLIANKKRNYQIRDDENFDASYKYLLLYSLPLTLINAIYSLSIWINYYILQNQFNYGEVALYSASMQWFLLLMFIPVVLRNVILSYFSKAKDSNDKVFKYAILVSFFSTVLPAFGIIVFSGLIEKVYGAAYIGMAGTIRILALVPIFIGVINVLEQYLFSINKNWIVFYICCFKDIGTCALFLGFIYLLEIKDAAYYLSLSYLVLTFLSFCIYGVLYKKTSLFRSDLNVG